MNDLENELEAFERGKYLEYRWTNPVDLVSLGLRASYFSFIHSVVFGCPVRTLSLHAPKFDYVFIVYAGVLMSTGHVFNFFEPDNAQGTSERTLVSKLTSTKGFNAVLENSLLCSNLNRSATKL